MRPEPQIDDKNSATGEFTYPNYESYAKDLRRWYKEDSLETLKRSIWDMELRLIGVIVIACTSHWIVGIFIFLSPFMFWFIEEMIFQTKHINKTADEVQKISAAPAQK